MPGLSDRQRAIIQTLIDTAPDHAIRSLGLALSADNSKDGPMAQIRDMVAGESEERVVRAAVFAPVMGICRRTANTFKEPFPAGTIGLVWRGAKTVDPDKAALARKIVVNNGEDTGVFDEICLSSAAYLRDASGTPFSPAAKRLEESRPGGAEAFAQHLDLAPLVRTLAPRVPEWLGRMNEDKAIVARLGYKDAVAISRDAGPRLLEMLSGNLDEPQHILRIISAVMDRPEDTYLASSELAYIGERLLADLAEAVSAVTRLDATLGLEAGRNAGLMATRATVIIAEFEQAIALNREGAWGKIITAHKKNLAQSAESLISKADAAVAEALPIKQAKLIGKMKRGRPHIQDEPTPKSFAKADALCAFIETSRGGAQTGGFASSRNKVIEVLEERINSYVDEVVDLIHEEPELSARAREYMDIAARLVGMVRDDKAAQIIRRRAAAA